MSATPAPDRGRHVIRLRGPWEYAFQASGEATVSVSKRILLPASTLELPTDFHGFVTFQRTFHRPTGLHEHDRVTLVVAPWFDADSLRLNGELLPSGPSSDGSTSSNGESERRFEIASRLMPQNQLAILSPWPRIGDAEAPTIVLGNVWLEIVGGWEQ